MIKARIRWCTCRVENILTLGKLLSLWFCFLLHSILFLISQTSYHTYKIISSYELARPVMGTIFLIVLDFLKINCARTKTLHVCSFCFILTIISTYFNTIKEVTLYQNPLPDHLADCNCDKQDFTKYVCEFIQLGVISMR